jgi:ABC-type glutathione transport system ATPase component
VHLLGTQFPHIFGTILRYSSPALNGDSAKENNIASSAEKNKSYVSMIRSCNLAGVVAATNEEGNMEEQGTGRSNDITLRFQRGSLSGSNLIAVTGETGSGKSLLVSRVADLVTGGKAASSLLQNSQSKDDTNGFNESLMRERPPATVEMGKCQPAARRNTRALSLQSCRSNLG